MGRTIIVGDVHACPDEFGMLLERVRYAQGSDRLVLVGDLVARGPDSGGAVARAIEAGALAVRGNHDEKVLRFWRARREGAPLPQLGERHQRAVRELREEHFAWLDALPLSLPLPSHGALVVHAGLDPSRPLEEQDPAMLLNIRSIDDAGVATHKLLGTPWARVWAGPEHVVFGHDARRGLQIERFATGLDTGCCYGRTLTAMVLDQDEPVPLHADERRARLVSIAARRAYCPMGDGSGPE